MEGAYKMHYAENTPIRIKLEQAEKKKQAEEDMSRIKDMQNHNKSKAATSDQKVSNTSSTANSSFVKSSLPKSR
jgi:hypothetical protein